MTAFTHFDHDRILTLVRPRQAVESVERALRGGLETGRGPARQIADVSHGQFLLMPSEVGAFAGVKVATVAPENPRRGRPRIQATYLLFDAETLSLIATMDGVALTNLRTPAVSIAAVRPVLRLARHPLKVVSFGCGPQGRAHVRTLSDVVEDPLASITWVARDRDRAVASLPAQSTVLRTGSAEVADAVAEADVIVCATSAREPLFSGGLPKNDAVVIAVGSHEVDVREIDGTLMARAQVIVEDVPTALREAGDVILAIEERKLAESDLVEMADIVTGKALLSGGVPTVFKSSGMAWQDLVVATEVLRAHEGLVAG
ncbi:ornithine cyclodeaminase family protein [Streptomyces sp. STR69]|uniref:ornithine cyclodeaminase family protein n=1 Tax=Streptomyces sp. STR69 TaxID=1796942 RepID=UPI0021C73C82|nr:ornithine cyclodeaminase family protein [Streptomyces sp. STR69]